MDANADVPYSLNNSFNDSPDHDEADGLVELTIRGLSEELQQLVKQAQGVDGQKHTECVLGHRRLLRNAITPPTTKNDPLYTKPFTTSQISYSSTQQAIQKVKIMGPNYKPESKNDLNISDHAMGSQGQLTVK